VRQTNVFHRLENIKGEAAEATAFGVTKSLFPNILAQSAMREKNLQSEKVRSPPAMNGEAVWKTSCTAGEACLAAASTARPAPRMTAESPAPLALLRSRGS